MNAPHGNPATPPRRGFGVSGSLAPNIVRELARAAEEAGYTTFWCNDGPNGEGLAALAEASRQTHAIQLAVGAIPLDRRSAEQIAGRVAELHLPQERLVIGVGSGGPAGGLQRVRDGIATLRQRTSATLVVAAMGPKMSALAGEIADGLLLDWSTPAYADQVREIVAEAAHASGRPRPWLVGYVFSALGPAAGERLRGEADYYAGIPSYAATFARQGAGPMAAAAHGDDPQTLQSALAAFDAALDEPVVRAVVASETGAAYLDVLQALAPG